MPLPMTLLLSVRSKKQYKAMGMKRNRFIPIICVPDGHAKRDAAQIGAAS